MKQVNKSNSKKLILLTCILSMTLCLISCAGVNDNSSVPNSTVDSEQDNKLAKEEDLVVNDTAIVIHIGQDEQNIVFQTITSDERYEVGFDGTTEFYDKYNQALSSAQIQQGDIADVIVSIHSKKLKKLILANAFEKENVDSYSINANKKMISIGDDNYKISTEMPVFFGETIGKISDINENDILRLKGIDRNIYSAIVESGHGYLRLVGEEYFLGGFVECGKIIKPIEENMIIPVPEGDYDMRVTYKGYGGTKTVHIERDKETLVDVSELKGEILKSGKVSVSIIPDDAVLFINGEKTDYNLPIELEYGVYQLDINCKGYKSMRKYLSVGNENAAVTFSMEEDDGTESDEEELPDTLTSSRKNDDTNKIINMGNTTSSSSSSSSSVYSNQSSSIFNMTSSSVYGDGTMLHEESQRGDDVITTKAQVYIDSPEGVEVYYDGSYKGVAPINFNKESGTHVITLRKDGYVTKSYTLTLGTGDNDETYSFNMLTQE